MLLGALVSGLALGWRSQLFFLCLLALAALVIGLAPLPARVGVALLAVIVVGSLVGGARVAALERSQLGPAIGHAARGRLTFTQAPRASHYGWSASAKIGDDAVWAQGDGRPPPLPVGGTARFAGSLRPLTGRDHWLAVQHVRAVLRVRSLSPLQGERGGLVGFVDKARGRATAALSAELPATEASLLRGMTLGDDSAMSTELRDAMRRSGLGHLVAASGSNVALLIVLVLLVGAAFAAPRSLRLCAAVLAVAFYVPLAGSGASIQRAGVMGIAGLVAAMASRPQSRWYALLLAAAVTLAADPMVCEQPGWQLSFAAVAAIGLFAAPLRKLVEVRGLSPMISEPLALTAAATLGSAPVAAAAFGTLSLVSIPANLATAFVVAPVTWVGMVAALVGQFSTALATPLTWLAYWPLAAIVAIAHFAAALPAAQIRASGLAVTVASAIAVALVWCVTQKRHRLLAVGTVAVLTVGSAAMLTSRGAGEIAPPPSGQVRISFLSVGQGDATLLQSGDHAALVDSGPPGDAIVDRLSESGVRRLDLLVATHAQADHLGGADEVINSMPVAALLDGRDGVIESEGMSMAASAARHRVPLIKPAAGQLISVGSLRLEVLSPPADTAPAPGADPNQRAIVILARAPGMRLLLTADAESDVLLPLRLPPIDVLKVSHHGSLDEGLPALLDSLRPSIAVIEVGAGNSYGHPTQQALGALARAGVTTWRTDKDGTVRIDVDRSGLHVQPST